MLVSLSALYTDLDSFDWYVYQSPRGTDLISPKARVTLRAGDVYGIKSVRGGRYRAILADDYRQNFSLEEDEGDKLINKSKAKRRPRIAEIEKVRRKVNTESHKQASNFRAWDSDFFKAARKINSEAKEGVDFSNYQWRKLNSNATLKIQKTQSKAHIVRMGTVFGVRFLVPAKGGIYIDLDGRRMSVSKELWDEMLGKSQVLPKTKWPTGKFTVAQMKSAMEQDVELRRQQRREENRVIKEQEAAEKRAEAEAAARAREKKKAEKKAERDRLALLKAKAKLDEARRKKEFTPREIDQDAVEDYIKNLGKKEQKDALDDIDLDYDADESLDDDLDLDEVTDNAKLEKILDIPEDADIADDSVDPLDALDAAIKEKRARSPINLKDFGDDEEDDEDDESEVEYEDDTDDYDDDYDDEDDLGEEEEEDPDAEFEDPEADEEEAMADEDEEETAAVDEELDHTDDEDGNDGDDAAYRVDEGDVVTFNSDRKDSREFAVLSIYPFAQNNSIMIYKLYDITTAPEGFHTVRINTLNKRKFEDMVTLVRNLDGGELQELLDLTDTYQRINEPIVS
ncbi:MAG: hypothetical protein ACRC6V_03620 [Bacteroidales bacterium]